MDALNSEGSLLLEILLEAFISAKEGMVNLASLAIKSLVCEIQIPIS